MPDETLLGGKPNSEAPPKKDEPNKETPPAKTAEELAAEAAAAAKTKTPEELAAEAAAAAKTPEQLAEEAKVAEKAKIDAAVADAVKPFAAPEKYELKIADDGPFSVDDLGEFAAEAKVLGLTQAQAQKLVDSRAEQTKATAARYLEEVKADPELGGKNLTANVAAAIKGRDFLFPPGTAGAEVINAWFDRTGLGNHKELMRGLARLGKALAEDSPALSGERGQTPVAQRDHAAVLYDKSKK